MAYSLSHHFAGQALLDGFDFVTGSDPNGGFVNFQGRDAAMASKLVTLDDSHRVRLGVDTVQDVTSDIGRSSVRLQSNEGFSHGLFIADFQHMPASTCGTWPSFWAMNNANNGADWPLGGELEIIEGANTAERNLFTAHTVAGCSLPSTGFGGQQGAKDCGPSPENTGCSYASTNDGAYGDVFNAQGGGVYALEWDSESLKLWHFPRDLIPGDIKQAPIAIPDPKAWGQPQAVFGGPGCSPDSFFFNMSIVIDINFCGDYAGKIWGKSDTCNNLAPTCQDYVANNPSAFESAYWDVNYIDVYHKIGDRMTTPKMRFQNSSIPRGSGGLSMPVPSGTGTLPSMSMSMSMSKSNSTSNSMSTSMSSSTSGSMSKSMSASMSNSMSASMTMSNSASSPASSSTASKSTSSTAQTTLSLATSSPTSDPSQNKFRNPSRFGKFQYLGCFGSKLGFKTWDEAFESTTLDNEACVEKCNNKKYAGVFFDTCYCADDLGESSAVSNDACNTPCPGNPTESCGGRLSENDLGGTGSNSTSPIARRDAPADILMTVYGDIDDTTVPPGAPGRGSNDDNNSNNGVGSSAGNGVGSSGNTGVNGSGTGQAGYLANLVKTLTMTVCTTYTTVCSTNPASLVAVAYTKTVTYTSCLSAGAQPVTAAPYIPGNTGPSFKVENMVLGGTPAGAAQDMSMAADELATVTSIVMTTQTVTCSACGPNGGSTVTLTVPLELAVEATATTVVAIVETVVPVYNKVVGMASPTGIITGNQVGSIPVVAGAEKMALQQVGLTAFWGLVAWLGVLGVMVAL